MAATIVWSNEAEEDFEAICHYMERQSFRLANQWGDRLIDKIELLKEFPEMGRIVPEKEVHFIREIFVGDYRLIYAYQNSIVNLLAIKHQASQLGKL